MARRGRVGSRFSLFLVLLLPVAVVIWPQQPEANVRVQVAYGFDGAVYPDRWNPVVVSVGNFGAPGRFELVLETTLETGQGQRVATFQLIRPLDLVSGERVRVRSAMPLTSTLLPLTVTLRSGDAQLFQQSFTPNRLRGRPPVVVHVGSGAVPRELTRFDVSQPRVEFLPDHWVAYQPVDMVVLNRPALERMTTDQMRALRVWAQDGGIVLWLSGSEEMVLARAGLSVLFPELFDAPAVGAPTSAASDTSAQSARSNPLPGSAHSGTSAPKAFTRIDYDAGRVYVFSPTELTEQQRAGYYATVTAAVSAVRKQPVPVVATASGLSERGEQILDTANVRPYPPRWLLGLLFFTYAITIGLAVRTSRPDVTGSLKSARLAVALTGVVMTGVVVVGGMGAGASRGIVLMEAETLQASRGDGTTRVRSEIAVATTRTVSGELAFSPGTVPIPHVTGVTRVAFSGGRFITPVEARRWSSREIVAVTRTGNPLSVEDWSIGHTESPTGAVAITNRSHTRFSAGALVTREGTTWFGPLSPGQTLSVGLRSGSVRAGGTIEDAETEGPNAADPPNTLTKAVRPAPTTAQRVLAERRARSLSGRPQTEGFVLAWTDQSLTVPVDLRPAPDAVRTVGVVELIVPR